MAGHGHQGVRHAHADSAAVLGNEASVPPRRARPERSATTHSWRPGPPGPQAPAAGRWRRSPTPGAPASNVTGTASSTRPPSGAWRARRRSSSSPPTTSAHASPTPSRWRRWPPASPAPAGSTWRSPRPSRSAMTVGTGRVATPARTPLGSFLPDGFDHAVWGADVSLADLNLCEETLDGIRNHSWSRPAPRTPEGEVVSWADRIAYVCHDWEDAESAGIVTPALLPEVVRERCGQDRSSQLGAFIEDAVQTTLASGRVGMGEGLADALAAFRRCNYDYVYLRPASVAQGASVMAVLRALVSHFADHPNRIPDVRHRGGEVGASDAAVHAAVAYVAGMTDRFAMGTAVSEIGWDRGHLPPRDRGFQPAVSAGGPLRGMRRAPRRAVHASRCCRSRRRGPRPKRDRPVGSGRRCHRCAWGAARPYDDDGGSAPCRRAADRRRRVRSGWRTARLGPQAPLPQAVRR